MPQKEIVAAKATKAGIRYLVYDKDTKKKKWTRKKKLTPWEQHLAR